VTSSLGSDGLGAIAGQLGIGQDQAGGAVNTALSVLTGALASNTSADKGAQSLDTALEKDHDGGIFDNIGGFLSNVASGPGAGILGHLLGKKQPAVEQAVAKETGLSGSQVGSLMVTVAPLLLGALGRKKKEEGLDAGGLAGMLLGEKQQIEEKASGGLGNLLSMVTSNPGMIAGVWGMLKGFLGKKG